MASRQERPDPPKWITAPTRSGGGPRSGHRVLLPSLDPPAALIVAPVVILAAAVAGLLIALPSGAGDAHGHGHTPPPVGPTSASPPVRQTAGPGNDPGRSPAAGLRVRRGAGFPGTAVRRRRQGCPIRKQSLSTPTGISSSRTPETTGFDASVVAGSSPPLPAMATTVSPATAARRRRPSLHFRRGSRSTPPAICTSRTAETIASAVSILPERSPPLPEEAASAPPAMADPRSKRS